MIIRNLQTNDSSKFLELMVKLDNETKFMMFEPGERKTTEEGMCSRIEALNDSTGVILGAFEGENIVGFVSINRGFANRIQHIGYVVIGVLSESSGKGIGTKLLKSLDEWADQRNICKLELTVMCHNEKAHNLYLRSGYKDEGIKKNSIKIDGEFYDEFCMGKVL